ncbi:MAG: glycoside hydrolase family 11 protein, partial [Ruminococcus sp.]|nr:glycoside hydrolase family 11 protein [Ruminococcus sp.]
MKKSFFKRLVSGFVTSILCFASIPTFTTNAADQQQMGNKDGYDYELWNQWGQGTATMDVGNSGAFTCSWTGIENCLFRTGKKLGSTKSYEDYNGMYIDYDVDYEPKGNSYMCIYGWTEDPTVEYYIVEAWGSWRPPGSNDSLGTVEANGNKYDIYKTVRENQPSIHGTETFYQYWSVRQDNPAQNNVKNHIEGRISVSKHFEAWEKAGLDMSGKMYEVALNIEGYQSNGSAIVNKNGLVIGEGDGDNGSVVTPPTPVEPDKDGTYFKSTFESGEDNWGSRGDASVELNSKNYYSGKSSLFVSGRTDNWNGTAISLDASAFIPGNSYSFSTAVLQKSGETTSMKLTLQYTLNGEDNYDEVAAVDAKSGEWTKLENTSFTIPKGAKNMLLYVEAPDSLTDFYIDDSQGAREGTKSSVVTGGGTVEGTVSSTPAETTTSPVPDNKILWGDANEDGQVDIADATAIVQHMGNPDEYALSEHGKINADIVNNGDGVTGADAVALQLLEAKQVKQSDFPITMEQYNALLNGEKLPQSSATTTDNKITADSVAYMANVRANMTNDVPASATNGNSDYGTLQEITYFSTISGKNKKANVLLPEGYSKNEKYPVLYVNHGIFGDHNTMLDDGMKIRSLAGNLAESGEAEKMIIVFTSMYTSKTSDQCQGFTVEETKAYDAFREDIAECLMPYIEQNYSVKTGRENTALAGFSMGGRETLYIGVSRPDLFGYIGAACPAPGVTPGADGFMTHPGNMTESDFRIKDTANYPYLWLITGGTNDTVVGQFPQSYHKILTTNNQNHIWQEIQGGGHDGSCVVPMMYNFMKGIFKVDTGSSSSTKSPVSVTPATTTTVAVPEGGVDISWIDPTKPMVAISFDDGASPATGTRIVNAIADSGFHATFFYVGDWIRGTDGENEVKYAFSKGCLLYKYPSQRYRGCSRMTSSALKKKGGGGGGGG